MKSKRGSAPLELRLWARAEVLECGCWRWTGTVNNFGYGKISLGGCKYYVHRLSYWLTHKKRWPKGGHILHTCGMNSACIKLHGGDMPACFNPEHLTGGTQSTNIKHTWRRGRRYRAPKEIWLPSLYVAAGTGSGERRLQQC